MSSRQRYHRHQVAPELPQHNQAAGRTGWVCLISRLIFVPFLLFSLALWNFFSRCLFPLLSVSTARVSTSLSSLAKHFLNVVPPPSPLFCSPFSFLLSWFCAHAPFQKSSGESHCGKFPARRFLCGSLVSLRRCQGSNLDSIYDTCVPHNSCTKTQNPLMSTNLKWTFFVCFVFH